MKKISSIITIIGFFFSLNGQPLSSARSIDWQDKVDLVVMHNIEAGESEFLVYLQEQADLSEAYNLNSKTAKGRYVFEELTNTAQRTQKRIISILESEHAKFQPYWIANMIWVRGNRDILERVAKRSEVEKTYANPKIYFPAPEIKLQQIDPQNNKNALDNHTQSNRTAEWNIQLVNSPQVWEKGFNGQGVVIGGQDTGYEWDHPALMSQYRGWNGGAVEHNYNWHDSIHEDNENTPTGNPCGFDSPIPCDDHGHGTHTMGTMVGDDGVNNYIGMAPGARWIGCRNMEQGWGSPQSYSECYQWFLAPTDLNNENPRPDLAPDVINNSWSCPSNEGCSDPNILLTVVENIRAAGIITVQSAGNSGAYGCGSINTPAAIYEPSFTVGATDGNDNVAGFSSRGPVTIDASNRLKPDISAPGVSILSSTRGGGYGTSSGTSMASPHVAGLVALLISANPDLRNQTGNVDVIEYIIRHSALPRTSIQDCGNVSGSQIPNNIYGWGRIDAWRAYNFSVGKKYYLPILHKVFINP